MGNKKYYMRVTEEEIRSFLRRVPRHTPQVTKDLYLNAAVYLKSAEYLQALLEANITPATDGSYVAHWAEPHPLVLAAIGKNQRTTNFPQGFAILCEHYGESLPALDIRHLFSDHNAEHGHTQYSGSDLVAHLYQAQASGKKIKGILDDYLTDDQKQTRQQKAQAEQDKKTAFIETFYQALKKIEDGFRNKNHTLFGELNRQNKNLFSVLAQPRREGAAFALKYAKHYATAGSTRFKLIHEYAVCYLEALAEIERLTAPRVSIVTLFSASHSDEGAEQKGEVVLGQS